MIKQRSWGDCGIAVLMNAFIDNGKDRFTKPGAYEELLYSLGRDNGITMQELCAQLFDHGFLPVYLPLDGFGEASGIKDVRTLSAGLVRDVYIKRFQKAIYQVKMKSGLLHFVYFDGEMIWDSLKDSPVHPTFDDYEAIVDMVFLFPRAPFFSPSTIEQLVETFEISIDGNIEGRAGEVEGYETKALDHLERSMKRYIKSRRETLGVVKPKKLSIKG